MQVYESVLEMIGHTPMLHLTKIEQLLNLKGHIYAKIERNNPGGSIKDRVAYHMVLKALEEGKIHQGSTLIESTSGNTGIGLAMVCAALDLKCIITMPDTMSKERINMMKAYGAKVILTPGALGMKGAIEKANSLCNEIEGAMILGQFDNFNNPNTHLQATGIEIYQQLDGNVDVLVAGIGTGGTISGCGQYLKQQNQEIEIVGVEPIDSPFINKGIAGSHGLQGIGAGFIPTILDTNIYDHVEMVSTNEAYEAARLLAYKMGVFVGISSGAALHVAIQLAKKEEYQNKNIVVILPDGGDRYLSTELIK